MRKQYYWIGMHNDVAEYIAKCMEFQKVKVEHRNPGGLLQPLLIPKCKWNVVTIDLITKFPKKIVHNDAIMMVVCKLTEVAQFILVKTTNIAYIYMKEVSRLYGISKAIVSNIDVKFTSNFWKGSFEGFGTNMDINTTYHP